MNVAAPSTVKLDLPSKGGAIFISYRRSDAGGYVGRISEKLAKKFKRRQVFQDLEAIAPGTNFPEAIREALRASSVLLAIVGPGWLRTEDADGRMRLANPEDYVRLELQTALEQRIKLIPVLVGGAHMPSSHELPEGLQGFADFQAFELSDRRWEYDLAKLVALIRPIVDPWFRFRQICLGLVALALVVGGVLVTNHIREGLLVQQALATAKGGNFTEALETLNRLQDKKTPDRTDPSIYLHEAEVYQMQGDAFHQNDVAEKAVNQATARGNNFVMGRAKALACDAKFKLGLAEAIQDCEQAERDSARAKDPQGQVRAINFKANILKQTQKPDDALRAYKEALAIAQSNGFRIDEYGALTNIGLILADRKGEADQDQARTNLDAARKGFEELREFGEASNVYNALGALDLDQGKIDPARKDFEKALELAVKGADKNLQAQAHLNLGLILEQTGSLDSAEAELLGALQIYEASSRKSDIAFVQNALGDIYLQQARYDDARKVYLDAEGIRSGLEDPGAQAFSTACLVNLDLQQSKSNVPDLLKRIENAIQQASNAGDSYSESFSRIIKAQVLLAVNKVEAQKEARKALDLASDNQSDNNVAARIVLAEIAAMNGNTNQALVELERLTASTYHDQNVVQNLEARLTSAKLMKQAGPAKQRSDAKVLLYAIQTEAQGKGYKLLAARAQAILAGKS